MEMANTLSIWHRKRNFIRIVSHLVNGNEKEGREMCVVRESDDSAAIVCVYVTNTSTIDGQLCCYMIHNNHFTENDFFQWTDICLMYRNSLPSSSLCRFKVIENYITHTHTYECAINSPVHIKAKRKLEQIVLRCWNIFEKSLSHKNKREKHISSALVTW